MVKPRDDEIMSKESNVDNAGVRVVGWNDGKSPAVVLIF